MAGSRPQRDELAVDELGEERGWTNTTSVEGRSCRRMIAPGPPYGTISGVPTLRIVQDDAADELLGRNPLALVIGMLLDQQFPMERAFAAPRLLADRLGVDTLDAAALAGVDPE